MNKYENLNPNEMLDFMEAERDFLNGRIEAQRIMANAYNQEILGKLMSDDDGIEGEVDSATEFGMDYQREAQNQ